MQELTIILCCTWKFAITFPLAVYIMKMSFTETLLYTNIGGILGVLIFSFLSTFIIRLWEKIQPEKFYHKAKSRKNFTRKRRRLVTIKTRYGLVGIVILTPVLLSIPVGAFLITKYYGKKRINYLWLISGLAGWSFVYTFFYMKMLYFIY